MRSLPPHYLAFRIVLAVVLCGLALASALWFVDAFPHLVRELGGDL